MLVVWLARTLRLEDVGIFGLYSAALQLGASLATLDIYTFTTRELLAPNADRSTILGLHLGYTLFAVAVVAPVVGVTFYLSASSISATLFVVFTVHVGCEMLATEVSRLLVPLGRPLASSVLLLCRSALWLVPVVVLTALHAGIDTLGLVVGCWLTASLASAIASVMLLRMAAAQAVVPRLSMSWVQQALKSSVQIFASTLVFRGILGLDRFVVEAMLGLRAAGLYTVYAAIPLGVLGLIESGVSAWRYPELVRLIQEGDYRRAREALRGFARQNSVASAALMFFLALAFPFLAERLLNPEYAANMGTFFIIVPGVLMYCLSMPFHYVIYAFRRDRTLLFIYITAVVLMMGWGLTLVPRLGIVGAGGMLSLALGTIALLRMVSAVLLFRIAARHDDVSAGVNGGSSLELSTRPRQ